MVTAVVKGDTFKKRITKQQFNAACTAVHHRLFKLQKSIHLLGIISLQMDAHSSLIESISSPLVVPSSMKHHPSTNYCSVLNRQMDTL